jgi:hypothetical protein
VVLEVSADRQRAYGGETHEDLAVIPVNESYLPGKAIIIVGYEG